MKIQVELNGTDENPWHVMGLKHNPFPQTGKTEYDRSCLVLQSLGGDPIPDTQYIRDKLKDVASQELIDLCCSQFVKGKIVKFTFSFEE